MAKDDDVLEEARELFEQCEEREADNRDEALDDLEFARLARQWRPEDEEQRAAEGRPCLTINRMPAFIRQVVNDARQNAPSISVRAVDDAADPATAEFKDPNLITTFALSSTGNPQTLYHLPPYNVAGQHFGVGQTTTTGKEDPRDLSVVGTGSISGNNVIFSTITNGGTPKVGMWIWDRPAGGTQYYAAGQAPKISGPCTGTYPALTCPLDRAVTNRSGHTIYASLAYGCVTLIQGGGTNGTSGQSYDQIYCDFRSSASTAKATFLSRRAAAVDCQAETRLDHRGGRRCMSH